MFIQRKLLVSLFLMLNFSVAYCEPTDPEGFNLDQFLKNIDIKQLIGQNDLLNIGVQFNRGSMSTTNVHDFNNFIIISVDQKQSSSYLLEFDRNQKNQKSKKFPDPWMGTFPFSNKELPSTSLQEGLNNVKMCMIQQGTPIPSRELAGIHIYKTQQTQEIVYNYVFTDPELPKNKCREFLYIAPNPQDPNEKCQSGFIVDCHFDIKNPQK